MRHSFTIFFLQSLLVVLLLNCQSARKEEEDQTSSKDKFKPSTEQKEASSSEEKKEKKISEARALYNQNCGSCHQQDGSGVSGMYPPLSKTSWVNKDKERLIRIVLEGISKKITVKGETYQSQMPPQRRLSDQKIATILTFIRSNFGNDTPEITPEEVAKVRSSLN